MGAANKKGPETDVCPRVSPDGAAGRIRTCARLLVRRLLFH